MSTITFSETFQTPYEQYAHLVGLPITVVGEVDPSTYDEPDLVGPMYTVSFADGTTIAAWREEVVLEDIEYVKSTGVTYKQVTA
jgi:hypothetical protein